MNFSISAILSFFTSILLSYAAGKATIEAGGSVNTPAIEIGTDGGKPLYLYGVISETKPA
jgi:uncharacterized protein YbaP (TraB family)